MFHKRLEFKKECVVLRNYIFIYHLQQQQKINNIISNEKNIRLLLSSYKKILHVSPRSASEELFLGENKLQIWNQHNQLPTSSLRSRGGNSDDKEKRPNRTKNGTCLAQALNLCRVTDALSDSALCKLSFSCLSRSSFFFQSRNRSI